MDVKGILFDLDGVVIKSMEQHLEAWQYAFRDFGVQVAADDFYQLEGRGVKSVVDELAVRFNIDAALKPAIMSSKINYYEDHFKAEFYDGLFSLLDYLKQNHIRMAIVTGGSRDRVQILIKEYFNGYFDQIVTADDVEHTKPYPEPYIKGAELLGLKPENCLVIENAPLGIESAKKAGMCVIGVQTTVDSEKLKECDIPAKDMQEVKEIVMSLVEKKYQVNCS
jgi:HAD superfamily hydrolase (TIGR01509 family)